MLEKRIFMSSKSQLALIIFALAGSAPLANAYERQTQTSEDVKITCAEAYSLRSNQLDPSLAGIALMPGFVAGTAIVAAAGGAASGVLLAGIPLAVPALGIYFALEARHENAETLYRMFDFSNACLDYGKCENFSRFTNKMNRKYSTQYTEQEVAEVFKENNENIRFCTKPMALENGFKLRSILNYKSLMKRVVSALVKP